MTNTLDISMITYINMLESDKDFENHGLTWLSYGILPYTRTHESNIAYKKFKQHYKIKHMQTGESSNNVFTSRSLVRLHFFSEEDLFWFKLKNL